MVTFRPEHVSRLGNRHIIFPTLSQAAFREFIDHRLAAIAELAFKHYKIRVEFSKKFRNRIYEEGVIPAQGIRPLAQTINVFAQDPIAEIFDQKINYDWYTNRRKLKVLADVIDDSEHSSWIIQNGPLKDLRVIFSIPSEYIRSFQMRDEPARSIAAVRLAADIVWGISYYRSIPRLARSNSRLSEQDGIIDFELDLVEQTSQIFSLRNYRIGQLSTLLASYAAEIMIFGEAGLASATKIQLASLEAKRMVGEAGLGGTATPN